MIVENPSQLGFGQVRGRGESRVQVFQTRRDQRHVEHTRLDKSQVDAQVGNVEPVVGFDEFSAVGGATSTCREFDAQPGQGRIGGVGKKPNEKQRPIPPDAVAEVRSAHTRKIGRKAGVSSTSSKSPSDRCASGENISW